VRTKQKLNEEFNKDIESYNYYRQSLTLLLFIIAIIVYIIGYISFLKKEYWLGFAFGLSFYILVIASLGVILIYNVMLIGSCDFCEEILKCSQEGIYPV
jgi:hypothetical protein